MPATIREQADAVEALVLGSEHGAEIRRKVGKAPEETAAIEARNRVVRDAVATLRAVEANEDAVRQAIRGARS